MNALFDSEIRTRLDHPKKGAIVIVAHRLAEDDLPGHVLQEGGWKAVRLPLIAPRRRIYEIDGFVWERQKGELLRPDAFTVRDVERLRSMKRPGFETLQQQNPGARDRLHIRADHFGVFIPAMVPPDGPCSRSILGRRGARRTATASFRPGLPTPAGTCSSIYGASKHGMPIFVIRFGALKRRLRPV